MCSFGALYESSQGWAGDLEIAFCPMIYCSSCHIKKRTKNSAYLQQLSLPDSEKGVLYLGKARQCNIFHFPPMEFLNLRNSVTDGRNNSSNNSRPFPSKSLPSPAAPSLDQTVLTSSYSKVSLLISANLTST